MTPEPTDKLDATTIVAVNGPADDTLLNERIVRRHVAGPARACFIWRSGCQGVALIGHLWWGVAGLCGSRLPGRRGSVRVRDVWSASYTGTRVGYRPQDLCSSHGPPSEIERGPLVGGLLTSGSRTDLCASTEAPRRPGSRERVVVVGQAVSWRASCFGGSGGCLREGVARWHGCRRNPVRMGVLPGGELPAEAGELAGDRDRDDPVGLAAGVLELAPAGVQPSLRAPGDVDDLGGWSRWRRSSASPTPGWRW